MAKEKIIHYIDTGNFVELIVNLEGKENLVNLAFVKNDNGKYVVQAYKVIKLSDGTYLKSNNMFAEDELDKYPEDILEKFVDVCELTPPEEGRPSC